MKKYHYLSLFLFVFIIGCKTNPPDAIIVPPLVYGKIAVSSNITASAIYLDNINTGKTTPDTITATTGAHLIRVEKDGFISFNSNVNVLEDSIKIVSAILQPISDAKIVLIEDFANVSCVPCVVSNKILESLSNIYFGRKKLVVIKFPANFPSPNDPFYKANQVDCDSRMNYYNVIIAPTTKVDGILNPVSSDSNDVKSKVQSRLSLLPKFKIEVKDSIAGDTYFINIKINVFDNTGMNLQDLVVHTVITETDIEFATPPGSNGETKFYDVMRKMLPSNNGEALGAGIIPGTIINLQRQFTIPSTWNKYKLHTVAYIQDKNSKEVFQSGSTF